MLRTAALAALLLLCALPAAASTIQASDATWDGTLAVHLEADRPVASWSLSSGAQSAAGGVDGWAQLALPDGRHAYQVHVTYADNGTETLHGYAYARNLWTPLQAIGALPGALARDLNGVNATAQLAVDEARTAAAAANAIQLPTDYARAAAVEELEVQADAQAATTSKLEGRVETLHGAVVLVALLLLASVALNLFFGWKHRRLVQDLVAQDDAVKIHLVNASLALGGDKSPFWEEACRLVAGYQVPAGPLEGPAVIVEPSKKPEVIVHG